MAIADQQVHSGNTVELYIAGKAVGRAQSISADADWGTETVHELGTIMPTEAVPLKYDGTVTLNRMRIRKNDLIKAGIVSLGADILQKVPIDIVVKDNTTGQVLEAYMGATLSRKTTDIRANEIIAEEATFVYLWQESQNKSGREAGKQLTQINS